MRSTVSSGRRVHALLLACLLGQAAEGKVLYTYDLDSLVFMSEGIVEGTIARRHKSDRGDLIDLSITAVHRGKLQKGTVVKLAALCLYAKPKPGEELLNTVRLDKSDRLVLLLAKAAGDIRTVVPSGVKLIVGGKVVGFSQHYGNPGPYVAETAARFADRALTLEAFRAALRASIARSAALAEGLRAPATPKDVPWLMGLLRKRAGQTRGRYADRIVELACAKLAGLHDPEVLANALPLASGNAAGTLRSGFGTPRGREFLLQAIADRKQPTAKRIDYARTLAKAGEAYHTTSADITTGSWRPEGVPRDANAGYIQRIARLALANARHEELCRALLESIDYFARVIRQTKEEHTSADLAAALPVLKQLHDSAKSGMLKFSVELATRHADEAAYGKLQSPGGPVISIIRGAYHGTGIRRIGRSPVRLDPDGLVFEYTIHTFLDDNTTLTPQLVLTSVDGATARILPWPGKRPCRGRGGTSGMNRVPLPKDVPAGRYRVHLRFKDAGKVVSTGHYAEVELRR